MPIYLKLPQTAEEWRKIGNEFLQRWNIRTLGAIDGKHCVVKCPSKSGSCYYSYKQCFSILLLAVCDHRYKLLYADVGAYGSQGDANIYESSIFKKMLESGKLDIPEPEPLPNSQTDLPYFFVGDAAFPLEDFMMKPFGGKGLEKELRIFNYRLSRARRCIENTFGIMAQRWRVLLKPIETSASTGILIIRSICCLHNFLIEELAPGRSPANSADHDDAEDGIWRQAVGDAIQRDRIGNQHTGRNKNSAKAIRDYLVEYLNSLSRARRCIENTFGIMAQRWRVLKPIETSASTGILIIRSICCLHNFLIEELAPGRSPANSADHDDAEDGIWRQAVGDAIQRDRIGNQHTGRNKNSAKAIRDYLVEYFNNQGAVPWQDKMIGE